MLETVSRSVWKSYLWSLKMDTSEERPGDTSGSRSSEPSVSRSSTHHQDADPRNTQVGQEKHQTKFAHFDDVFLSKPPLNCVSPFSSYNGSILLPCSFLLLFPPSKSNRDTNSIPHCPPLSKKFVSLPSIAAICTSKKALFFHSGCKRSTHFAESRLKSLCAVSRGIRVSERFRSVYRFAR